jgi:hypothetical protein
LMKASSWTPLSATSFTQLLIFSLFMSM